MNLKIFDTARVFTQHALDVATKKKSNFIISLSLTTMGEIHSRSGQKNLAMEYYRQSIPLAQLVESYPRLSYTFLGMAKLFENEGQMDSSLFYANQAFKISRGVDFAEGINAASSFLYSVYKDKGNADSALFYIEVIKATNDSLFSKVKINQLHSLEFDEKLRQKEIEEERKHNLQYAAIAIGLITFIILFFALSRSIIVKTKFIEFFGVLGLLAVFEFINLFIHPYLGHATNDSPVLMLLVLIVIGAMLVPLHHKLEKWITKIMVEKNKKIRLEAAKKTIRLLSDENLEGEQTN